MSEIPTNLESLMHDFALLAGEELNTKGLPSDPSNGNRCDALTLAVMEALQARDMAVSRELHTDEYANWHYLLAHEDPGIVPTDESMVSDLNPWQWREYGGPILHGPRHEVMQKLRVKGASEHFVALRGLASISKRHDIQKYPAGM